MGTEIPIASCLKETGCQFSTHFEHYFTKELFLKTKKVWEEKK